jgi:Transient receptor potential (TRP) ion channel/ML-like domain
MRFHVSSSCTAFVVTFLTLITSTYATRLIESKSLNPCQDNSNFTATLFNVVFTPDNRTLAFDVVGVSSIQGNVTAELQVIAYGFNALRQTLDPCTMDLGGLCPMSTGQINIQSNIDIDPDVIKKIPGIAYGIPDLDGLVRIYINDTDTRTAIACVEAQLSNGKTVDQKAVGWTTAVIAGLGLVASGVTSGMGHSNTAAHVAANALSLFGFFQAQAIIGMTGVKLPPIVQSWTQNFQWSMGIIRVKFLQDTCTWYQRSTGGTPTMLLSTLSTTSVQVQKRSLDVLNNVYSRARDQILTKRTNGDSSVAENSKLIVVRGIDRVGFRASIEQTNIFLTGTIFFVVFCFFIGILIALFKAFCEIAVRNGWMKTDKFQDFRNGWKLVLKGILFRLVTVTLFLLCPISLADS